MLEGRKELERNRREVIVGRKQEIGGFSSIDKAGISLEEEEEEAPLALACCVSQSSGPP
jgi:hypothetical protein